jgi:hypothetical protein
MAAEPPEPPIETWPAIVRYDGVFDFDGLYKMIIEHLRRHNYWFYETLYKHKPWSPMGTELVLKWYGERKLDEYYMYRVEFEWHFMDFHHVEVLRDGKKMTLTKAYFWVSIRGKLLLDWQGLENGAHGESGKFTKLFGKFFRTNVIDREKIYDYFYPLFDEVNEIQALILNFVQMESTRMEKNG